jgi:[ribosomal protein S5]-alanine N-acetyltransferase
VDLTLPSCRVRGWRSDDLESLVRHADDREVWINLRDRFPYPYHREHGRMFLESIARQMPTTVWAIEAEGAAVGGIGIEPGRDVERVSAEIGYWLGRPYWGRGIMTEAVRAVTAEVFKTFDFARIFALPFAGNVGSIRVLEKAGYVLEGRMPQSTIKDGRIRDQLMFGAYRTLP